MANYSADDYLRMADRLSARASMVQNSPMPTLVRSRRLDDNLGGTLTPLSRFDTKNTTSTSTSSSISISSSATAFRSSVQRRHRPAPSAPRDLHDQLAGIISATSPSSSSSSYDSTYPKSNTNTVELEKSRSDLFQNQLIKVETSVRQARAICQAREQDLIGELETARISNKRFRQGKKHLVQEKEEWIQ